MSAAHTQGPYTVHLEPVLSRPLAAIALAKLVDGTSDFSGVLPMVVAANGLCVAVTGCGPDGVKNANFFAAGPELLEALEAEHEWREREEAGALDPDWDYEVMVGNKRRAAIAKATGRVS